ncbi:ABC transporter [Baekduia alba]|uniref:ABC transporter permease subunit n=1 Tax=Baekduia alba TaxID=2997333 RepID=UPI0023418E07|nr:ATP-binding cassette domain-containing protein [Baekduia alba]WCB91498.1 ABC transporter [Baekduia alba]
MDFWIHVGNLAAIYAILGLSLNLLVGYAGLFSMATGALYGVGAYAFALTTTKLGWPLPLTLLAAVLVPAAVGAVVAIPSLRISGDYLVIASFGLQTLIVAALTNLDGLTGGPGGVYGIPAPDLGPLTPTTDPASYLPITIGAAVLVTLATLALTHSPFGRALEMIRDDEVAAAAAGRNVVALKVVAFMISSGMAGIAGALYASYVSFIDPTSFAVLVSVFVLSIVVVGGAGTVRGAIVGAIVVNVLSEAVRYVPVDDRLAGNTRQAIYGVLLIAVVFLRPRGLAGRAIGRRAVSDPAEERASTPAVPRTNGSTAVQCEGLVVGYGNLTVVRGVSLSVGEGEIVLLAGHNGAGKSTLLKAIAGQIGVREGRLSLNGQAVELNGRRQGIGFVPQTGGTFGELTIRENLLLGGYVLRRRPEELARRIDEALEPFPQLADRLEDHAKHLSGGLQRQLAIAMALVPGHRVLLLDEPSIGLSPSLVTSTLGSIQDITRARGLTVVVTEQNVRPALAIADHAYVLKAGQVSVDAPAEELAAHADLWRLF